MAKKEKELRDEDLPQVDYTGITPEELARRLFRHRPDPAVIDRENAIHQEEMEKQKE